ncbi:MAG: EamA family transporter, partial [Elusimicrobia bacterium]|nr:EamA family transporter [Elusimicrobiota bacterium]
MTTALYAAVCLIWGSTWLVIRLGMNGIPSFLSAGLRFTLAAGLSWRMTADGRKSVLMAGFLNFGAAYALVYWSEMRVASGLVASLYALEPLTIALLTAFVTRTERLTRGKAAGVAIGVAGTLLVCWPESGVAGADAWGLTAALASMLLASVNLVAQSLWSRRDDARVLNAWS